MKSVYKVEHIYNTGDEVEITFVLASSKLEAWEIINERIPDIHVLDINCFLSDVLDAYIQ